MTNVHFATMNTGKVASLQQILAPFGIDIIQAKLAVAEDEAAGTEVVAQQKAIAAFAEIQKPVVAVDSGFFINALGGWPGAFAHDVLNEIGIEGFLKKVDSKDRSCMFRNCLAYLDVQLKQPEIFVSEVEGSVADESRGELSEAAWGELWKIFIPVNETKTLAEMTDEEIQTWRRGILRTHHAIKFAQWFKKNRS